MTGWLLGAAAPVVMPGSTPGLLPGLMPGLLPRLTSKMMLESIAVLILTLAGIVGCRPAPTSGRLENPSARGDSLAILEGLAADAQGDPETVAAVLSDVDTSRPAVAAALVSPRPAHRRGSLRWRLNVIGGYRPDHRAVVEKNHVFSFGIRSYGESRVGYLRLRGWGPLRSIHAGHFNVRMGERLLLGRSIGMYPVTSPSPVAGGFRVSPSLSRWFGRPGIAAELAGGPLTASVLLAGNTDRIDTSRPGALWASLCGGRGRVRAGLCYGSELTASGRPGQGAAMSLLAAYRDGGVACSGEIARYAGRQLYFALRLSDAKRRQGLRWKILCFRAPCFPSTTEPLLDLQAPEKTNQGARLDVTAGRPTRRLVLSLIVGRLVSPVERKSYRRVHVSLSGRLKRSTSWECSLNRVEDCRYMYPSGGLIREGSGQSTGETRARVILGLDRNGVFSHRLRVDYTTGRRRGSDGILLSVGSRLDTGRLEIRWQVSAYSIASGGRGYVTRPGIGSFEFFSSVYGRGSDVSMRMRWRLADGISLIVFHGAAWSKENRTYFGLDWRRR